MVTDERAEGRLRIVIEGFVAIGFGEVERVVAGQDVLIDQPVGHLVVLQPRRRGPRRRREVIQPYHPQRRGEEQEKDE